MTYNCLQHHISFLELFKARWQHLSASQLRLVYLCAADETIRPALPQNRVETLIGSQAEFEEKTNYQGVNKDTFLSDNTVL